MLAGLAAPSLVSSEQRRDRVLLGALLVLTVGAVLSTQSRAGLAMLGVLGAGLALLIGVRGRRGGRVASLALIALAAVVLFVGSARLPEGRTLQDTSNLEARQQIWSEAWHDFTASPLVGHGLGYSSGARYGEGMLSVHNEFLGHLVDGGLIGGVALTVLFAAVLQVAVRTASRSGPSRALGEGVVLSLAMLATSMLVNAPLATPLPTALLWIALGICASIGADRSG